jgi:hypothetical protein
MRYYIWCDESEQKGTYCSNFYGGILVNASDFEVIKIILEKKKLELFDKGEMKWILYPKVFVSV